MDCSAFKPNLPSLFLACLVAFFSCKSQSSHWIDEECAFAIPSLQMSLRLPQNDNWTIADPDNLPPSILFCGVMPEDGIGLYLFSENNTKWSSIGEMTPVEIEQQISPIYKQTTIDAENIAYAPLETEKCRFLGYEAIKFKTAIKIGNETGEMCASFKGYMFFHRGRLMKYVLSEPCVSDSDLGDNFDVFITIQ